MRLTRYDTDKKNLISSIRLLEEITSKFVLPEAKLILEGYCQEIEDHEFKLVVVGEFSRGKSTFINALIGEKILPSKSLPTTATLNKISYGEVKKVLVHFHEENTPVKEISISEFSTLNAPREPIFGDRESEEKFKRDSEFLQSINYINIQYPLDLCKNNITIIDTPGTNDLDPIREMLTNTIIPQSDVAIMLLSSVKILSDSEVSLLKHRLLENDIQKIFLVINFKDQIEPSEYYKLINFVIDNTREFLLEPKVFLVSAAEALNAKRKENGEELISKRGKLIEPWEIKKTGFVELEKEIGEFLEDEPGKNRIEKYKSRIKNFVELKLIPELQVYENFQDEEIANIQEIVNQILKEVNIVKSEHILFKKSLHMKILDYIDLTERWYKKELSKIEEKVSNKISSIYDEELILREAEDTLAETEKMLHVKIEKKLTENLFILFEQESKKYFKTLHIIESNIHNFALVTTKIDESEVKVTTFAMTLENSIQTMIGKANQTDSLFEKSLYAVGVIATAGAYLVTGIVNFLFGDPENRKREQFRSNVLFKVQQKNNEKKRQFKKQILAVVEQSEKAFIKTASNNIENAIDILNNKIAIQNLSKAEKEKMKREVSSIISEVNTIMKNL